MKKVFQLKVRSSIKTKLPEIITHMRGSSPPKYLLFTLSILVIPTISSTAFVIQGSFLKKWDKI